MDCAVSYSLFLFRVTLVSLVITGEGEKEDIDNVFILKDIEQIHTVKI